MASNRAIPASVQLFGTWTHSSGDTSSIAWNGSAWEADNVTTTDADVLNGAGNWTVYSASNPGGTTYFFVATSTPFRFTQGGVRHFQMESFAETGSNTALTYTNVHGQDTLLQYNGTRFVGGGIEWQPPAGFGFQGYYKQSMTLTPGTITDEGATINCMLGNLTPSVTLVASTNLSLIHI